MATANYSLVMVTANYSVVMATANYSVVMVTANYSVVMATANYSVVHAHKGSNMDTTAMCRRRGLECCNHGLVLEVFLPRFSLVVQVWLGQDKHTCTNYYISSTCHISNTHLKVL